MVLFKQSGWIKSYKENMVAVKNPFVTSTYLGQKATYVR